MLKFIRRFPPMAVRLRGTTELPFANCSGRAVDGGGKSDDRANHCNAVRGYDFSALPRRPMIPGQALVTLGETRKGRFAGRVIARGFNHPPCSLFERREGGCQNESVLQRDRGDLSRATQRLRPKPGLVRKVVRE